jgi:photosystem II stability/assembly factor-like uncharacterized protein
VLRKYPWLSNILSILVVALYLGVIYYLVSNVLHPSPTPEGLPSGALSGGFPSFSNGANQFSNQLLTTTDAGKSWSVVNTSAGNNLFTNLSCPGDETCYASGLSGGIYLSTDGGKNWSAQFDSRQTRIRKLDCPSPTTCYALTTSVQDEQILTTADGGKNWSANSAGTGPGDLLDLACPGPTTCFVVGRAGRILNSADGAKSFKLQEANTERNLTAISCPDTSHCLAVGQVGTSVYTGDGGQTWTKQPSSYAKDLTQVSCPEPNTCFALAGTLANGNILATTDAGRTWKALNYDSQEGHAALDCPNARSCFAAGESGRIRFTLDGGQTWTKQSTGTARGFAALACPSPSRCFALTRYFSYPNGYNNDYYNYDD